MNSEIQDQVPVVSVFISAASRDLRTLRSKVGEAIHLMGCRPVYQEHFPHDYREIREMLRERMRECQAVLHFAGLCYGEEPKVRPDDAPRRSYTQIEYDLARELGIPCYVFVLPPTFPYDESEEEPAELQALQKRHRETLLQCDRLYSEPADDEDVVKQVLALRVRVEALARELAEAREQERREREQGRRGRKILFAGLLALAVIGAIAGIWFSNRQSRTESDVVEITFSVDLMRAVVEAVTREELVLAADSTEAALTPAQRVDKAIDRVAKEYDKDPDTLHAELQQFGVITKQPDADPLDRAYGFMAVQEYEAAAREAQKAAKALDENSIRDRPRLIAAWRCAGDALALSSDFDGAIRAYRNIFDWIDQKAKPLDWIDVAFRLSYSLVREGFFAEAHEIANQAFNVLEEGSLKNNGPLSGAIFSLLGNIYEGNGNLEKAEDFLRRAVRLEAAHYPPQDMTPVFTLGKLASVHRRMGQCAVALEEHRTVLGRAVNAYGERSSAVASAVNEIGEDYLCLGAFNDARESFEAALAILDSLYGGNANHPDILEVRHSLAVLAAEEGRWGEARSELEDVLRIRRVAFHDGDKRTIETALELARLHLTMGAAKEARQMAEEFLDIADERFGPVHMLSAQLQLVLCEALLDSGNTRAASKLFDRIRLRLVGFEFNHPLRAALTRLERDWAIQTENLEEADRLGWSYFRDLDDRLGPAHPKTIEAAAEYASVLDASGKRDQADNVYAMLERDFEDPRRNGGTLSVQDTVRSEIAHFNLAMHFSRRGEHPRAARELQTVQERIKSKLGSDHPWTIRAKAELGLAMMAAGEKTDGEYYVRQAIALGRVNDVVFTGFREDWQLRLDAYLTETPGGGLSR